MPVFSFKTDDSLIPIQNRSSLVSQTATPQLATPEQDPLQPVKSRISNLTKKITPKLDTALQKVATPIEKFREASKEKLSFLEPENEKEAVGLGLVPIRQRDGSVKYIDALGASGVQSVGIKSKSLIKTGLRKVLSKLPGREKIVGFAEDATTQLVDRFAPIKRLTDKAVKLTTESNPYIAARNFAGHFGKIQNRLDNLSDILRPINKDMDNLVELAKLERFEELAKRGITKFEGGLSVDEIVPKKTELIAKLGKEKTLELGKTLSHLRSYTNELLTQARDAGIISKESFDIIVKNNQKYIPLQRLAFIEEQANNLPRGRNTFNVATQDLVKTIKGSEKEILNPIEGIVKNTYRTVNLVERNKVAQKVADLSKFDEFKDVVFPLKGEVPSGFDKLSVFKNGIKEEYAIPKDVAEVLKGINQQSADIITKMARIGGRALRAGATSLNVPFLLSNAIRDFQTATVVSKVGFTPADWARGFWSALRQDDLYRGYLESGGSFAGFFERNKSLPQTVKKLAQRKSLTHLKTFTNPFKLLQEAAEKVELAPRIGVYNRALKKGLSDAEAAFLSREATVDFAKAGSTMKVVNQWIPFINARLQGTINVGKKVFKNPAEAGLKITGLIGIPLIGTYIHNTKNFPEVWNDIAQFDKDNNFIIIYGNEQDDRGRYTQVFKIPKGDIGRIFGNPVENFLAWVDKTDPKSIGTLATQIFSDISPVGFERDGKLSLGALLSSVAPPTGKVAIESATNKNLFTGRDIVPERLQKASPELQFDLETSPLAVMIGRFLNISPMMIENAVGTQFGGLGRQLIDINTAGEQIGGRFGRAHGREGERKDFDRLNEIEQTVIDERITNQQKAEKLYNQLKDLQPNERLRLIRDLASKQQIDAEILSELGKTLERELSDFTSFEKSIKNRPVEVRAKFIVDKLKSLPLEDRQRLFVEWTEKKIITEEVAENISEEIIKQANSNKTD